MPENRVWKCIGSPRPVKLLVCKQMEDEGLYAVRLINEVEDEDQNDQSVFHTYLRETDRVDAIDRVRGDTAWANDRAEKSDVDRMIESLKMMSVSP